jgi:hypothetical protein
MFISLFGCQGTRHVENVKGINKSHTGIIKDMRGLDGCAFLILLNDGKYLQPVNLDSTFMNENLKVEFTFTGIEGMSVCMKGDMVQINEMKKLK